MVYERCGWTMMALRVTVGDELDPLFPPFLILLPEGADRFVRAGRAVREGERRSWRCGRAGGACPALAGGEIPGPSRRGAGGDGAGIEPDRLLSRPGAPGAGADGAGGCGCGA